MIRDRVAIPSLFISHGAPTLAVEPSAAGQALSSLGQSLRHHYPGIKGIILMSPHWMTRTLKVQTHLVAPILHDFSGFPASLYTLDYPAKGSLEAAERIGSLMNFSGLHIERDAHRGLDHGAWVPLRYLFPNADIPVLQVSMPYPLAPEAYFALGKAIRTMTHEGYLLIGSGGLTHNLSHFRGQSSSAVALPYVAPFSEWFRERLEQWDLEPLFAYRRLAPHALEAHPVDDHLMPLFFALGASPAETAKRLHASVSHSLLAMDIYGFGDVTELIPHV